MNKEVNSGKTFMIKTYGCQMNEHDSEKLSAMLGQMNYLETDLSEEADLIILNTCCVRENAELKVYGNLGELKHLKEKNPDIILAICGCMMQQKHVVEKIKSLTPLLIWFLVLITCIAFLNSWPMPIAWKACWWKCGTMRKK